MTFLTETPGQDGEKMMFNISNNRGSVIDRAIVRFNASRDLPKFMLNNQHTRIYIPQEDGTNYAVVHATDDVEEMPVNFKAAEDGSYTLTANTASMEMQYLRLIDQKTNTVVDLLTNPAYTFDANATDYASRFIIQFKANSSVNTMEYNPIQYFKNGQLTITGVEGNSELQIIDMLGRIVSSTIINGEYNQMLNNTTGIYMIRLINGDKTYTQKIVVE